MSRSRIEAQDPSPTSSAHSSLEEEIVQQYLRLTGGMLSPSGSSSDASAGLPGRAVGTTGRRFGLPGRGTSAPGKGLEQAALPPESPVHSPYYRKAMADRQFQEDYERYIGYSVKVQMACSGSGTPGGDICTGVAGREAQATQGRPMTTTTSRQGRGRSTEPPVPTVPMQPASLSFKPGPSSMSPQAGSQPSPMGPDLPGLGMPVEAMHRPVSAVEHRLVSLIEEIAGMLHRASDRGFVGPGQRLLQAVGGGRGTGQLQTSTGMASPQAEANSHAMQPPLMQMLSEALSDVTARQEETMRQLQSSIALMVSRAVADSEIRTRAHMVQLFQSQAHGQQRPDVGGEKQQQMLQGTNANGLAVSIAASEVPLSASEVPLSTTGDRETALDQQDQAAASVATKPLVWVQDQSTQTDADYAAMHGSASGHDGPASVTAANSPAYYEIYRFVEQAGAPLLPCVPGQASAALSNGPWAMRPARGHDGTAAPPPSPAAEGGEGHSTERTGIEALLGPSVPVTALLFEAATRLADIPLSDDARVAAPRSATAHSRSASAHGAFISPSRYHAGEDDGLGALAHTEPLLGWERVLPSSGRGQHDSIDLPFVGVTAECPVPATVQATQAQQAQQEAGRYQASPASSGPSELTVANEADAVPYIGAAEEGKPVLLHQHPDALVSVSESESEQEIIGSRKSRVGKTTGPVPGSEDAIAAASTAGAVSSFLRAMGSQPQAGPVDYQPQAGQGPSTSRSPERVVSSFLRALGVDEGPSSPLPQEAMALTEWPDVRGPMSGGVDGQPEPAGSEDAIAAASDALQHDHGQIHGHGQAGGTELPLSGVFAPSHAGLAEGLAPGAADDTQQWSSSLRSGSPETARPGYASFKGSSPAARRASLGSVGSQGGRSVPSSTASVRSAAAQSAHAARLATARVRAGVRSPQPHEHCSHTPGCMEHQHEHGHDEVEAGPRAQPRTSPIRSGSAGSGGAGTTSRRGQATTSSRALPARDSSQSQAPGTTTTSTTTTGVGRARRASYASVVSQEDQERSAAQLEKGEGSPEDEESRAVSASKRGTGRLTMKPPVPRQSPTGRSKAAPNKPHSTGTGDTPPHEGLRDDTPVAAEAGQNKYQDTA